MDYIQAYRMNFKHQTFYEQCVEFDYRLAISNMEEEPVSNVKLNLDTEHTTTKECDREVVEVGTKEPEKPKRYMCSTCFTGYCTIEEVELCCNLDHEESKLSGKQTLLYSCPQCSREYLDQQTASFCCLDEDEIDRQPQSFGISDKELDRLSKWQQAHTAKDWKKVYQECLQDGNLECTYCDSKFSTTGSFQKHFYSHHININPVRCKICNKLFKNSIERNQHVGNVHTEVKQCEFCDKKCTALPMKMHLKMKHGLGGRSLEVESMRTCDMCEEVFSSRAKMFHHRRRAHPDAGSACSVCDVCGAECDDHIRLQTHKARAHGAQRRQHNDNIGDKVQCEVCYNYYGAAYLPAHMSRMHDPTLSVGEQLVKSRRACPVCLENVPELYFVFHMRRHLGPAAAAAQRQVSYRCMGCDERFPTTDDCAHHINTHHVTDISDGQ